jgi:hypothetical protein
MTSSQNAPNDAMAKRNHLTTVLQLQKDTTMLGAFTWIVHEKINEKVHSLVNIGVGVLQKLNIQNQDGKSNKLATIPNKSIFASFTFTLITI